jgi:hypothetical protein
MSTLALLRSPGFFRYWVGYGGILYGVLGLVAAGGAGAGWFVITVLLGAAWYWETSTGYCRRCTHFNCGPHGAIMRRYFARDFRTLPIWRGVLHAAGDLFMFAWPQRWIWRWPWLGAATVLWFVLAALAVLPFSVQARRDVAKFGGHPPNADVG